MEFTIRPLDFDRDRNAVAALANALFRENSSPQDIQKMMETLPVGGPHHMSAAVGANGTLLGYTNTWCRPQMQKGYMLLRVLVDPVARGQGVGSALYLDAEKFALENESTLIRSFVRDDDLRSFEFCAKRGFREHTRLYESVLDLASFDPGRVGVQDNEVRIASMTDLGYNDESRSKLHKFCDLTEADVPDQKWWGHTSADDFATDIFDAPWFRPDGVFVALDGEEWVGVTMAGRVDDELYVVDYTAVRREYRGRGLAQALKLLSVEWAKECGAKRLKTNNDTSNAPMVAVNRKFGFQPEPGWIVLVKES